MYHRILAPIFAAAALISVGCGTPGGCDDRPAVQQISACAALEGSEDAGSHDVRAIDLLGAVLESGTGVVPDHCLEDSDHIGIADPADASWFRMADDDEQVWTVGLSLQGSTPTFEVGQVLSVTYDWEMVPWEQHLGRLEIRDDADELIAFAAVDSMPENLAVDGLIFAEGSRICAQSGQCGAWGSFDLDVTQAGGTETLSYGGELDLADLRLLHGGFWRTLHSNHRCDDWGGSSVLVGGARL